jgi:hypothetical protein
MTISFPAGNTVMPGGTVEVQLEVTWGLARDLADNNVDIDFSNVNFVSACDPLDPPPGCTPDPATPVTYVAASAVTTCDPGTMTATAAGSEIDFDFAPLPGFNLGPDPPTPPPPPAVGESCTINFDVMVGAGVAAPVSILVEAASTGVCNIGAPGNDASDSNSSTFAAPGRLVLLRAAANTLRRRPVLGPEESCQTVQEIDEHRGTVRFGLSRGLPSQRCL